MTALKAVQRAEEALAKARAKLTDVRGRRRVLCSCGKMHPLNKLELLITHWYVEPSGCTGGDYWKEGEWQFVCPTSGTRNRIMFDDYGVEYEKRGTIGVAAWPTFKRIYRYVFASSRDTHDNDRADSLVPHANNYYIDQHRARFELPAKPTKT